jgi:putative MFS transporter
LRFGGLLARFHASTVGEMREILKQKLIWIAAFGYFVDLYDLVLYGVVRIASLRSLGIEGAQAFSAGTALLNWQMAGMLVGGIFFGLLGDRKGRKTALFGSIFLYSAATFLNAYVVDFTTYALARFFAGFGLAGELGAAVTLASEALPKKNRGLGTAFIAALGFLGAVLSSSISQKLSWQDAYRLGGILGFALLFARVGVAESRIYLTGRGENTGLKWGSLGLLFGSRRRIGLILLALFAGVPIWYVAGILSYFAPEFAREFGIRGEVSAGTTIMMGYLGAILGDILCGFLCQVLKSRKKAIFAFIGAGAALALLHPLFSENMSASGFYWTRLLIGAGNGYSAMLVAWTAEMFGTNLRTTAASMVANLMRASVIPISFAFGQLNPSFGLVRSSAMIGGICFALALIAALLLPETFERDLSYVEESSGKFY